MGVEIANAPVTDESFESMAEFVYDYLQASVENEGDGGRMRWYPWHSAEYRFNHIMNVVDLATEIARKEGANVDVVKVASLFHDIAKLEADQDVHAEAGARVAREYLQSHAQFPDSFIDQVCRAIENHSHQGDLDEVSLEAQCLIEADLLDKVGANGITLMLLRMGYEARTHMDAAEMVQRVLARGEDARKRVQSDAAESIAHQRLKRVAWFREWLEGEVSEMSVDDEELLR
ncbi:metal dependent phosphohydrolase [Halodesulfurarchaeum formicicum]|uniref:Metal dependent phosphohydrolase n=1 Tax=Halodesulfurarchaeum formicicum TaxID=1873524 RepID=A0A1D8S4B7_9EURY|nr:HD domain-containing protein [Halodesulfurarchaeum formicicum]AOW80185.1 metal dependent phosphohydrolase [Halodesulfurarchaeum formicicum]APE95486.1 metal dependent phosphohydrolase [Halodesulfurarchaeum formicicum]